MMAPSISSVTLTISYIALTGIIALTRIIMPCIGVIGLYIFGIALRGPYMTFIKLAGIAPSGSLIFNMALIKHSKSIFALTGPSMSQNPPYH